MFKKLWNIITGADANADGKVDIKDAFIKAEKKSSEKAKTKGMLRRKTKIGGNYYVRFCIRDF